MNDLVAANGCCGIYLVVQWFCVGLYVAYIILFGPTSLVSLLINACIELWEIFCIFHNLELWKMLSHERDGTSTHDGQSKCQLPRHPTFKKTLDKVDRPRFVGFAVLEICPFSLHSQYQDYGYLAPKMNLKFKSWLVPQTQRHFCSNYQQRWWK